MIYIIFQKDSANRKLKRVSLWSCWWNVVIDIAIRPEVFPPVSHCFPRTVVCSIPVIFTFREIREAILALDDDIRQQLPPWTPAIDSTDLTTSTSGTAQVGVNIIGEVKSSRRLYNLHHETQSQLYSVTCNQNQITTRSRLRHTSLPDLKSERNFRYPSKSNSYEQNNSGHLKKYETNTHFNMGTNDIQFHTTSADYNRSFQHRQNVEEPFRPKPSNMKLGELVQVVQDHTEVYKQVLARTVMPHKTLWRTFHIQREASQSRIGW